MFSIKGSIQRHHPLRVAGKQGGYRTGGQSTLYVAAAPGYRACVARAAAEDAATI